MLLFGCKMPAHDCHPPRTLTDASAPRLVMHFASLVFHITASSCGAGGGISWLYPLRDGVPPIGWDEASRCAAVCCTHWLPSCAAGMPS
jgi:hypothetical protein